MFIGNSKLVSDKILLYVILRQNASERMSAVVSETDDLKCVGIEYKFKLNSGKRITDPQENFVP